MLNVWFDAYQKMVQVQRIKQENTYNMNESEFSIEMMKSTQIIIDSTLHTKRKVHSDCQKWVLMIECICADKTILSSLKIFKSKNILQNWILNKVLEHWFFSANMKDWTSNLYVLKWLKCVFKPTTHTKVNEQYQLLVCDSHDSYISESFIAHCL